VVGKDSLSEVKRAEKEGERRKEREKGQTRTADVGMKRTRPSRRDGERQPEETCDAVEELGASTARKNVLPPGSGAGGSRTDSRLGSLTDKAGQVEGAGEGIG
jgi:hypothetical protein